MEQLRWYSKTFDEILDDINKTLLKGDLTEILEVTYAYNRVGNDDFLNRTLFKDFIGLKSIPDVYIISLGKDYIQWLVKKKLKNKKDLIRNFLQDLKNFPGTQSEILQWSLQRMEKLLSITEEGVEFELEKAWFPLDLSEDEVEEKVEKIENLEAEVFWGNIRENPEEIQGCCDLLADQIKKEGHNLSEVQKKFIDIIFSRIKKDYGITPVLKEEKTEKKNNQEILNQEISRDVYTKIFELVFEFYEIDMPVVIEERSSIYDGEDGLFIPDSENYTSLPLEKILHLISHEIESHYINLRNNEKILGKIRWPGNLEKEEGLAKFSEYIFSGEKLEDMGISHSLIDIFMWEILEAEDLKYFIEISKKIFHKKPDILTLFYRRKRNYPMNYRGVQHKDTSYSRGLMQVVEFISAQREGENIRDLYVWKVGISDLWKVKKDILPGVKWIKYPVLISEIIFYALTHDKIHHDEFQKFIQEKYDFLDFNKEVEKIGMNAKRKIIEIISLIKSEKENN